MDKIFAIVGESGSGKTTISDKLEQTGLRAIKSFTTRKPRYEGEDCHVFTTKKQYESNKASRLIIAETYFDGNYYWSTKGQYHGNCLHVVDPIGVKYLKENIKDFEITVIYLKTDELRRARRMIERKYGNELEWQFIVDEEILQRLKYDKEAFKIVQCDYCIDANRSIEEVFEDVKSIIDSV